MLIRGVIVREKLMHSDSLICGILNVCFRAIDPDKECCVRTGHLEAKTELTIVILLCD